MEIIIGDKRTNFVEGFKPKSLAKFLKDYSFLGSKEDVTNAFNKLNGNNRATSKKTGKTKQSSNSKASIQSPKTSARRNNKSK